MMIFRRMMLFLMTALSMACALGLSTRAQQQSFPKQADLPNPYRLEDWPTLPANMNGGKWGELIRADIDPKGNIWVFHRCFNTEPAGYATCVGRTEPPILEFNPAGKILASFGSGMFAFPHGFTVDREGNIWASDANDSETVLGVSAKDANGVVRGHQVFKMNAAGKVLMTLGKEGVKGNGPDTFDMPTGIAIGDQWRHLRDRWPRKKRSRREIFQATANSSRPGDITALVPVNLTSRTIFRSAVRRTACMWPTAATAASRFSIRTETSSPRGSNSEGPAPSTLPGTTLST